MLPWTDFVVFPMTTIFFSDFSAARIGRTLNWVSTTFGWYYLLAATLYIVFVVCIACSRFSSVKLGPETLKPGVQHAELGSDAVCRRYRYRPDVLLRSPTGHPVYAAAGRTGQTMEAARQSMVWTLFHYRLTGWSMYALMGMALGYFAIVIICRSPYAPPSIPFFGKNRWSHRPAAWILRRWSGFHFGIATTLGIGVVQLNYGLNVLFDIPDSLGAKAALIVSCR